MDPFYFIVLASVFGFFMAWGVGANDVANAMGTSVGSKALTIRQAILVATVFEFTGAFLAGGEVTDTIRGGLLDASIFLNNKNDLIIGQLSTLLASGTWLAVASRFGWPVSTTHTIVGAIVGFGAYSMGSDAVQWIQIGTIVASWIFSPILGGVLSYALFTSVRVYILDAENPFDRAQKIVPMYILVSAWIFSMVTMKGGLPSLGINLSFGLCALYSFLFSLSVTSIGVYFLRRVKVDANADKKFHYASVEKLFTILMLFTACAMAFAHGSNDVANAIGPLAAVVSIVETGEIIAESSIPMWILLLGSLGIVTGLVTYGHKVIATIGTGITELTPSRGFAATLAAASTVVFSSGTGLPVSTTHTLVGAILGVGLARGIAALNLSVINRIFMSWMITLPVGAVLAIIIFEILTRVIYSI